MPDFPYFPLYPTDLLGDDKVIAQNLTEFGAYMRLLCLAWQQKPAASIPSDDALIARLLGVPASEWARLRPAVIPCWQLRGGRFHNARLRAVYKDMMDSRVKRQIAGRLGGKQCSSNAQAMLKQTGSGSGSGSGSTGEGSPEGGDPHNPHTERHDPVLSAQAGAVIEAMGKCLGVTLQSNPQHREIIMGRLNDGATVEQCLAVVRHWDRECRNDARKRERFSVAYLFSPKVFPDLLAHATSRGHGKPVAAMNAVRTLSKAARQELQARLTEACAECDEIAADKSRKNSADQVAHLNKAIGAMQAELREAGDV